MLKERSVERGKFESNSPEVINSLDHRVVSDKVRKINIDDKFQEQARGIVWNFQFRSHILCQIFQT